MRHSPNKKGLLWVYLGIRDMKIYEATCVEIISVNTLLDNTENTYYLLNIAHNMSALKVILTPVRSVGVRVT